MDTSYIATEPELIVDLLDEVCQTRETYSAVTLAVALVDRGRLTKTGDPVGLVSALIEDLGQAGLVTYRLRREWSSIPLTIRATRDGFIRAGYKTEALEVGSRRATHGAPLHPGPTDFRSQPSSTWGGEIERESLADHLDRFPEHKSIHPAVWECGPYLRSLDMAKRGADHTATIVSIINSYEGQASADQIRKGLGLSNQPTYVALNKAIASGVIERRAVKGDERKSVYVVKRDESGRVMPEESTREAIVSILQRFDTVSDSASMMAHLAQRDTRFGSLGLHGLDHQLFAMEKAGIITFKVSRDGRIQRITKIRLGDSREQKQVPRVDEYLSAVVPIPQKVVDDAPPVIEALIDVIEHRYPILDSLRLRASEQDATNRRVDAYLSAASALESVDEPESARLLALAGDIATSAALSNVEAEYLRYASDKETTDGS